VKWAFHLITCLPNTLQKKTGYVRALYAKFLYFVKRVDHMGCYVVLRRENEGNCTFCKYIIVLSASDTLYTKVVSRLACSNYVRFFCWGRFLTCRFCCSQPMGTWVIDMGTNKYVVTFAYCPLFPWITQNNMDLMASGPTCPVPYITFLFWGPTTQWTTTIFGKLQKEKTTKKKKQKNTLKDSSEISNFKKIK